ncbi:MAG: M15 family metallopeptidase [Pseudomonadota bacterium]
MRLVPAIILALAAIVAPVVWHLSAAYITPARTVADPAEAERLAALEARLDLMEERLDGLDARTARAIAPDPERRRGGAPNEQASDSLRDAFAQVVLIADRRNVNADLTVPRPDDLIELFGPPREDLSDDCQPVTNEKLKELLSVESVGPIRAHLIKPALISLRQIFANVQVFEPELYARIQSAGSLCARQIRGSTGRASAHAYGLAVDINIDGYLDTLGDGRTQLGLTLLADFFRKEGWIWGWRLRTRGVDACRGEPREAADLEAPRTDLRRDPPRRRTRRHPGFVFLACAPRRARLLSMQRFRLITALLCAVHIAACAEPPPPDGIVQPAAISGSAKAATPAVIERSHRLVGLRIEIEQPPEGLLDDTAAGVIEMLRVDTGETARLVFIDGALTAHALAPGPWRIRAIAGQHCGFIDLPVPPGAGPLLAGDLILSFPARAESDDDARMTGRLPARADIQTLSDFGDGTPASVDVRPLIGDGAARPCRHIDLAVARPDIDPSIERLTPLQIAELVFVGAVLGAATGGAAAAGSISFVSGGGGLFFLAL